MPAPRVRTAAAALALLLVLSGCAGAAADPPASPIDPLTSSEGPIVSPQPSRSSTPDVIDTTTWLDFATDDGSIAFRYPADWALDAVSEWFSPDADRDDVAAPYERWMDSATLTAPNGQPLLAMHDFVDVGGACGDVMRPIELLAIEPAVGQALGGDGSVSIATVALGTTDDRWRVAIGITGDEWVDASEGCTVYFVFGTSDGGASMGTHFQVASVGDDPLWTVETLDEARAYMDTEEYATILEVLRSVETA